jgi:alpha-beta hydrolase superfamily lysophospholipase
MTENEKSIERLNTTMNEETFKGVGDLSIFGRSWRPPGKARGVVVIAHGFNSHSGQYQWAAEQFLADDLAVYALDHHGRGKSGGERFYVEKVADYVSDLATFIRLAKSREPGLPVFLLGHSAGGVIACLYAIESQAELAGLICESFAFQVPAPGIALAALKGLSHIAPHTHVLALKGHLTRSQGRAGHERRSADRGREPADADGRRAGPCHRRWSPAEGCAADDAPSRRGFHHASGSDSVTP